MGMSQMCTGAGDYFRTSKPHSEKLCKVLFCIGAPWPAIKYMDKQPNYHN